MKEVRVSLKQLVNNHELWTAYQEDIKKEVEVSRSRLEQTSELEEIYRLQGEIRALKKRLKLREKVNSVEQRKTQT